VAGEGKSFVSVRRYIGGCTEAKLCLVHVIQMGQILYRLTIIDKKDEHVAVVGHEAYISHLRYFS
jgi:hypothetical protein